MSTDDTDGDRIAKVLSRAGVASRRDAERMIAEGRVKVNGRLIASPALNVGPADRISVDGTEIGPPEPVRVWLYHKPAGVVTTTKDEEGRPTVFDNLPEGMPYVMTVGRLDLNSEGLLLLTNDGELKRRLELPATGWLRRYRVRINGTVAEDQLEMLRRGVTVEGIAYQPMEVTFDRQQGANAWLTIGLREGKNREIRRVMDHLGVQVNRLIRVSYGPFQLGDLAPGAVEELRARTVRDQLGLDRDRRAPERPDRGRDRTRRPATADGPRRAAVASAGRAPRARPVDRDGEGPATGARKPRWSPADRAAPRERAETGASGRPPRGDAPRKVGGPRPEGSARPPRAEGGFRPDRPPRGDAPRKVGGPRPEGSARPPRAEGGPRPDRPARGDAPRKVGGPRPEGGSRPPRGDAPRNGPPRSGPPRKGPPRKGPPRKGPPHKG